MSVEEDRLVVGWREWVSFPDWGDAHVRAKLDTGARTSAIHVEDIEQLDEEHVRFHWILSQGRVERSRWVEARVVRQAHVKPSHGKAQSRPIVRALMRLGEIEREIEVGLVSRRSMRARMLLGRTAMEGLLVDPHRRHVMTPRRWKRPRKENA